jgi:hypothetical protein
MSRALWKLRLNRKPWMIEKTCKTCCERYLFEECASECPLVNEYTAAKGLLFAAAVGIKSETKGGVTHAGTEL